MSVHNKKVAWTLYLDSSLVVLLLYSTVKYLFAAEYKRPKGPCNEFLFLKNIKANKIAGQLTVKLAGKLVEYIGSAAGKLVVKKNKQENRSAKQTKYWWVLGSGLRPQNV